MALVEAHVTPDAEYEEEQEIDDIQGIEEVQKMGIAAGERANVVVCVHASRL